MSFSVPHDLVPPPDLNEVRRALECLIPQGKVFELRSLTKGDRTATRTAVFHTVDSAIDYVPQIAIGGGLYYMLNPVRPDLRGCAKNQDILERSNLLIDIDSIRSDVDSMATDDEKRSTAGVANAVMKDLEDHHFSEPILIDTGNGFQLVYRISLPNDDPTARAVARLLERLADKHDTPTARVDTGVHNAGRLARLPGTWNRKGTSSPERPHRMATIVAMPDLFIPVTLEAFESVAGMVKPPQSISGPRIASFTVSSPPSSDSNTAWFRKSMENEIARAMLAPQGERHNTLRAAARTLAGQLHHGAFTEAELVQSLLLAGERAGLEETDRQDVVAWGLENGKANPLPWPSKLPIPSPAPIRHNGHAIVPDVPNVLGGVIYGPENTGPNDPDVPNVLGGVILEEWEDPILDVAPDPLSFPLDVLPDLLAELCRDGAKAVGCPVDYFATIALGLVGGIIGRTVNLRFTTTWKVAPNLFTAVVGSPGSKKSPALHILASPLHTIDRQLRDDFKREKDHWKKQDEKERGPEPTLSHLTLDDTTREALAKMLSENPRGIVLIKDELSAWVADLNAYRAGKGSDRQFWMSLNTGSLVKVTRKGSPEPLVIPHPCGAVVGCLTPSSLPQINDGSVDDGWFDRIIFTYPKETESSTEWVRNEIAEDLLEDWQKAVSRLWSRAMMLDEGSTHLRPYWVNITPMGESQWAAFFKTHRLEQKAHDFPRSLAGTWSKYEGFTLRLALILSQLHQAYDADGSTTPRDVDGVDVLGAARLIAYFKSHFRRVRIELGMSSDILDHNSLSVLQWIKRENFESFTSREFERKFRGFSTADRHETIGVLTRCKIIRLESNTRAGNHPGRKKSNYEVNPYLIDPRSIRDNRDVSGVEATSKALTFILSFLIQGSCSLPELSLKATECGLTLDDVELAAVKLDVIRTTTDGVETWSLP